MCRDAGNIKLISKEFGVFNDSDYHENNSEVLIEPSDYLETLIQLE